MGKSLGDRAISVHFSGIGAFFPNGRLFFPDGLIAARGVPGGTIFVPPNENGELSMTFQGVNFFIQRRQTVLFFSQ
ncbi:hypothetical protein [Neolewinella lacunae]|uniref:hypothetical protein n=1 Tax=Neolewinella lacunae TaxID=1517758 RepID=UPI001CA46805|nr:hypothetical protein [Neolewinella lacunae]